MKGREFKYLREEAGLRQHEVAEKLQVTRETIYHWENKKNGEWEIPFAYYHFFQRLIADSEKIEAIKVLRPVRKKIPYAERTARRLARIREAATHD